MEVPLNPPKDWFEHPGSIPTDRRITITPDGRVYGYVSLWDTCHAGLPGCVKPPKGSPSNYGFAHQGETMTAEGDLIATANIGGGAGHAPLDHGAPAQFYENTSTQLMRVRYGEDQNGLWFSGALWPNVNDFDVARIRASSISGDWRWMGSWRDTGSGYDFAGACFVNIPGFPMANAGDVALSDGEMRNIAASVNNNERFTPPSGVREAMRRGLKWHEEGHSGSGLRPKTVAEARSIANGESQSVEKLTRMRAWFARHQVDRSAKNRESDKPTPGEVAWELWGGDAGKSWSESVMSRVEKGSIAATVQDANGNILAMYASSEVNEGDNMSCDGQCACKQAAAASAEEMCACGKVAASACDCDGANEDVTAAAAVEGAAISWLPQGMTEGDLADGDFAWLSDAYKAGNESASAGRKLPYKIKGEVNEAGWRAAWTRAHQMGTELGGGPSREEVIAKLERDKPEGIEIQAAADMPQDQAVADSTDASSQMMSMLEGLVERISMIEEMLAQQRASEMATKLAK